MTGDPNDRILVVDDEPAMLWAVKRNLSPTYQIATARNVKEALARLKEAHFDIALVDVQLNDPKGDGYLLCQKIRARYEEIDVILMTGSTTQPDEKLFNSLEKDAFYFLFKPFEAKVLRALVERCFRLKRERQKKEAYARTLADDLESARKFQQSLLPKEPMFEKEWTLDGRFRPCDALGGDIFFYRIGDDNVITFALCDITGHGVAAAMIAGMLRASIDAAQRRAVNLEALLSELQKGIGFLTDKRFATAVCGQLFSDGRLRYFNAGHPPVLFLGNGKIEEFHNTGTVLMDIFVDQPRTIEEVMIPPGGRLLVYSDGIMEAQSPANKMFELKGLRESFKQTAVKTVPRALDEIIKHMLHHSAGRPITDDVSLLMIERKK